MKKKYIVKSTRCFNNIISNGYYNSNEYAKVYRMPNQQTHARFGIAVPKKLGNAVLRNEIKRQVKEIIRTNMHLFEGSLYDYIIIINNSFVKLKFNDKIKMLQRAMIKEQT